MKTPGTTPATVLLLVMKPATAEALSGALAGQGFTLVKATDLAAALPALRDHAPGLVLLDFRLGESGVLQLCDKMRRVSSIPILMLAATPGVEQVLKALECGADDCLRYPPIMRELLLRIHVALRRTSDTARAGQQFAGLELYPDERRVAVQGANVLLTALEFDLLALFTTRPHVVLSRTRIAEILWEENWSGDERLVDSHICRLREKLNQAGLTPSPLVTVRGVGYAFQPK